jgi:hypothetical protein
VSTALSKKMTIGVPNRAKMLIGMRIFRLPLGWPVWKVGSLPGANMQHVALSGHPCRSTATLNHCLARIQAQHLVRHAVALIVLPGSIASNVEFPYALHTVYGAAVAALEPGVVAGLVPNA